MLMIVIFALIHLSLAYRDSETPSSGKCDVGEIAYRGTDNRWIKLTDIPFDATFSSDSIPKLIGGSSGSMYRYPLTHCPDARSIRCDPDENLFHAHNYLSVSLTDVTYTHYMKNLFNYTMELKKIKCSDYVKVAGYDPLSPGVPPSGFPLYQEPLSRSKLAFHSIQMIGDVMGEENCSNFWTDGLTRKVNPPFFCVYTPTIFNKNLQDSKSCNSFITEDDNLNYHLIGENIKFETGGYIVNPNCGVTLLPNNSETTKKESDYQPDLVNSFFQIWMYPIDWERYNWEFLFSRNHSLSEIGYDNVLSKQTERFVDCDREAVSHRNPNLANLCLPYKKRVNNHPLLTNPDSGVCNVMTQIECAPPPEASEVNEGTECFCSFPYKNEKPDKIIRDPWDIYCFSGDLSSVTLSNKNPSTSHGLFDIIGNDYIINQDVAFEAERLKEITNNQWTFYDWTPVFTSPPFGFTCPPPGYLVVERIGRKKEKNWVIRSLINKDYYTILDGDIAPFVDPLSGWISNGWPDGFPFPVLHQNLPDSPPSSGDFNTLNRERNRFMKEFARFKNYTFSATFKNVTLTVRNERKLGYRENRDKRVIASEAMLNSNDCSISESARHYLSLQRDYSSSFRGDGISCFYDIRMFYVDKSRELGPDGRYISEKIRVLNSSFELKYQPTTFSEGFGSNNYYPNDGKESKWVLKDQLQYEHEDSYTKVYTCFSSDGSVSDCGITTTQNIRGEAAFVTQNLFKSSKPNVPTHLNGTSFFADGLCSTPTIQKENITLPRFCRTPGGKYLDAWYKLVLGVEKRNATWRRELGEISSDDLTIKHVDDLIETRDVNTNTTYVLIYEDEEDNTNTCPPEQLITCDVGKGWIVLGDFEDRWKLNHTSNFTSGFYCPNNQYKYVVYIGTSLSDIGLVVSKQATDNTDDREITYLSEGANIECIYSVMFYSNTSNNRNYFSISFSSSGYVVDSRNFLKNVLPNNTSIQLDQYEIRKANLQSIKRTDIDSCLHHNMATFSNYSDSTIRKCTCTNLEHQGSGCVCGGSVFMSDSPIPAFSQPSLTQSGRFSYVSKSIKRDKWNDNHPALCSNKPILESKKVYTSSRLYFDKKESLDPVSVRFICPVPASLICTNRGTYASQVNGIQEEGTLFRYTPNTLKANYRLASDVTIDSNTSDSWSVMNVDPRLFPYTCWAPKSGKVPSSVPRRKHNFMESDIRLEYTSDIHPQMEIAFASGSGRNSIKSLKCGYVLSAPQCTNLLSDEGLWKTPPTVSFSLSLVNPSLVWLDQISKVARLNFQEECKKVYDIPDNDTYVCPGVSGWCGKDIGLRVLSDPIYKSGALESISSQHKYCCTKSGYLREHCVSGNDGSYQTWFRGDEVERKNIINSFENETSREHDSAKLQRIACQYMFSKSIAGVIPNESVITPNNNSESTPDFVSYIEYNLRDVSEKRSIDYSAPNAPDLFSSITSGNRKDFFESLSNNSREMTELYLSDSIDKLTEVLTQERSSAILPRSTGCPDPRRDFTCENGTLKISSFLYYLSSESLDPCEYILECLGETVFLGDVDPFRSSETQWGLTNVTIHFVTEGITIGGIPPVSPSNITLAATTMYDWLSTYSETMNPFSNYSVACEYKMYRNPLIRSVFDGVEFDFPSCPIDNIVLLGPEIVPSSDSTFIEYHKRVNQFESSPSSPISFFESPYIPVRLFPLYVQRRITNLSIEFTFGLDTNLSMYPTYPEIFIPLPGWDREENSFLARHVLSEIPSVDLVYPDQSAVLRSFPMFRAECETEFGRMLRWKMDNQNNETTKYVFIPSPCSSFSHTSFVCDCPFYDIRATAPFFSNVATSCATELSHDTIRSLGRSDAASGKQNSIITEGKKTERKQEILPRERTTCPEPHEIRKEDVVFGDSTNSVFLSPPGFSRCVVYSANTPPDLESEIIYVENCRSSDHNTTAIEIDNENYKDSISRIHFAQASIYNGANLYCTYAFQNANIRNGSYAKDWYLVRYRSDHPYSILSIHTHNSLVFPSSSSIPYSGGWTSGSVCSPDQKIRNPVGEDDVREYTNQWFSCTSVCGDIGVGDYIRKSSKKVGTNENGWPRWQEMVDPCTCPVARMDSAVVLERDDFLFCIEKYGPSLVDPLISNTTSLRFEDFWFQKNTQTTTATDLDPRVFLDLVEEQKNKSFVTKNKKPLIHTCPPASYIDSKIINTLPYLTSNTINGVAKMRTSYSNNFITGGHEDIFGDSRQESFVVDDAFPIVKEVIGKRYGYRIWKPTSYFDQYATFASINHFDRTNITQFFRLYMCGNYSVDDVYGSQQVFYDRNESKICSKKGTFVGAQVILTESISSLSSAYAYYMGTDDETRDLGTLRDLSLPSGGNLYCSYSYPLSITNAAIGLERESIDEGRPFTYPREAIIVLKSIPGDHYSPTAEVWKTLGTNSLKPSVRFGSYYDSGRTSSTNATERRAEDFWTLAHREKITKKKDNSSPARPSGSSYWVADCGLNLHARDNKISDSTFSDYTIDNPCSCRLHLTNGDSRLQYEWDYRTEDSCIKKNLFGDSADVEFRIDYTKCNTEDTSEFVARFEKGLTRKDGGISHNIDYPSLVLRLLNLSSSVMDPFPETSNDLISITQVVDDKSPLMSLEREMLDVLYYNATISNIHGHKFFGSLYGEFTRNIIEGSTYANSLDRSSTCPPPECVNGFLSYNYVDSFDPDSGYICLEKDRNDFMKHLTNDDPYDGLTNETVVIVRTKEEANEDHGYIHGKVCSKHERKKDIMEDIFLARPKTINYKGTSIIFRGVRIFSPKVKPSGIDSKYYAGQIADTRSSGEREPVISCEYYDRDRDKIIQIQSFINLPKTSESKSIFVKHSLISYAPLLYPRQTFWKFGHYERIESDLLETETLPLFWCSSYEPSRSVCHCPLIRLSTKTLPWDGCTKCGGNNDVYSGLNPFSSSGNVDKFSSSICSSSQQTVETATMSFIGMCGFMSPNRTHVDTLRNKKFNVKKNVKHMYLHKKEGFIDDPFSPGELIRDPRNLTIPDARNFQSDKIITTFKKDAKLIIEQTDNTKTTNGICKGITKTDFFSYAIPGSILRKYFDLLENGYATTKKRNVNLFIGFKKLTCPQTSEIKFDKKRGFYVNSIIGHSSWDVTRIEYNENIGDYVDFISPRIVTNFGTMDIDPLVRFVASYETTRHQCKYLFHTISSFPIPFSGSEEPYSSFPFFFYMSPKIKDITNLVRYSCRNYLINQDNTFDPIPNHADVTTIQEKYDSNCYIHLPEDSIPSIAFFIDNVTSLLLCNTSGTVSGLPKTIYDVEEDFKNLGSFSQYPSGIDIDTHYQSIVSQYTSLHPYYSIGTKIRYCSSTDPINCRFISPSVPFSEDSFVSYG